MKKILSVLGILFLTYSTCFASDMRIVQVDGLYYSEANSSKAEKVIESINKLNNIDFVVFTGNNIAKPNQKDLENFLRLTKKLDTKSYVVIGNKDVSKQKSLGKDKYVKTVRKFVRTHKNIKSPNYVFKKNDIVFVVVDGSKEVIPSSIGYYKSETLTWLDNQLELNKDKKVVIFQHFPIIPPANKETHYTYKADEYLKVLSKHNNVKAIISGHFNVNKEINKDNVLHISTAEAPMYRIIDILDYETESPIFWSTIKK